MEFNYELKIYSHVLADISKAKPLAGEGARILLCALGKIDKNNHIPSPSSVACELNLHRSHVSRAYQVMLRDGYMIKDGEHYCVHPFIAYRGSEGARLHALNKQLKASMKRHNQQLDAVSELLGCTG